MDRYEPALVICRHVHEARGTDRVGRTTLVNCGPAFNGCCAVAEVGQDVRVELCRA